MKSHVFGFALLSVAAVGASAPAQAASTRTFVSSSGVDTNPCTITQPCATFAVAYANTLPNGIIAALDPGKYGPLTITTGLTINGNGWAAVTGPSGGNGISIDTGATNVTLMGLEIDGANAGGRGIYVTSTLSQPASLTIRDCRISNFVNSGIGITPSGTSYLNLLVANTFSLNNGADGIKIEPTSDAAVYGMITGSTVSNNASSGFDFEGASYVTLTTSVAANNNADGIYVNAYSVLTIRDTVSSFNADFDFNGSGGGFFYLFHNTFGTYNGNGGSAYYSDGTNQIQATTGILPTKQSTY